MRLLRLLGATGIMLGLAVAARAQSEVKITGQIRLRHESIDKEIRTHTKKTAYSLLRTRAMIEAISAGNTHVVIQFQESRQLADRNNSGWSTNAANVEVHQAYVQVDRMFLDGLGLRAGRFEFNLGNQRVFGSNDWHNYGRAWEGGEVIYDRPNMRWSAFWLEWYRHTPYNGDIVGVSNFIQSLGTELTAFYLHNGGGLTVPQTKWANLGQIGLYWKKQWDQFDLEFNGDYQFGEARPREPSTISMLDISAGLLAMEAGYTVPGSAKARLAAGIDATSGDGDSGDDDWHAYDNLFYSYHPFRGYMDYFASDRYGLVDLLGRGKVTPWSGWTFSGDMHYFLRAEKYVDFTGKVTRRVGAEIDLGLRTSRVPGADLEVGASAFQPTESIAGFRNPDVRWWWYGMITANF